MNAENKKKNDLKAMQKELIDTLFKRSGVKKSVLYEDAIRRFVASNLDLLTPAELKKYKGKVLL